MAYLKLADGSFIKVSREDYLVVSREEVERKVQEKRNAAKELEEMLATAETPNDAPVNPVAQPEAPQGPTDPNTGELLQPTVPETTPGATPTDPNTGLPVEQPGPQVSIQ